MDCPRCGVSVFADVSSCGACGWQLARPFGPVSSITTSSARVSDLSAAAPLPHIRTAAADAFALSPLVRQQRVTRPRRAPVERLLKDAGAIAVLPPEARWEAPPRLEVIESPRVQSAFDFSAAEQEAERLAGVAAAPVSVRLRAGLLDATLIFLASAVFFSLFALLSSQVSLARRDLLVYLLAGYVLAALYFGLFTLLGGRTPGMQYYGLRPVTFEGKPLPPPAALRRAFGYGVSIGSLLLGFFWAAVDERRLTWHDHISQTFLTDRTKL